jgi:hypothetical protein
MNEVSELLQPYELFLNPGCSVGIGQFQFVVGDHVGEELTFPVVG